MGASEAKSHEQTADVLTIFGITGDLARKMTFRALYHLEARERLNCRIVGVAIDDWSLEKLLEHAHEAIRSSVGDHDEDVFDRLAKRISYVQGDYADPDTFDRVAKELGDPKRPVFYLEVPPSLFATVVEGLGKAGLVDNGRVVIEKPFGHDLESAKALNAELQTVLREDQILRIDHYLGKEPVMDITYLRFANSVLEPVWNREHVSHVQMTIAENFGVDDRGRFYDAVGAMRDVIQNHALQVLSLIAMEPPAGNQADSIRDKKLELFKAVRSADPERYVRGQYDGFLEVKDVAPDSTTETFAAVELAIDNWRWSGVPFFIRAGKCMPAEDERGHGRLQAAAAARRRRRQAPRTEQTDGADRAPARDRGSASSRRRREWRPMSPPTWWCCSRRPPARTPSPTSGCWATRSPAAPNSSPARTRSRRPGGSSSPCSKNRGRSTPTSRESGGRRRRRT